jgi:hypothetical protein
VPIGLCRLLCPLELVADEGVAESGLDRGLGGAQVQAPAAQRGQVGVERLADQGVPEVVPRAVSAGLDEEALGELAQGRVDLLLAVAGDRGEQVEVERPPDHRRGTGQGERPRGQVRGPGEHGVGERVRHRAVGGTGRADDGEELLHVQRDAVAALVHGRRHCLRHGGAGDQGGHRGRLGAAEPGQADLLGEPLGEQPGPPGAGRHPGIKLIAAVRADDQQRRRPHQPGHPAEHLRLPPRAATATSANAALHGRAILHTAAAAARPATRPENRQPPRNVPSREL